MTNDVGNEEVDLTKEFQYDKDEKLINTDADVVDVIVNNTDSATAGAGDYYLIYHV
jgi:hypothetical protein